jgi:DNA-binding transcriptional regulator YhcF (GntR family)
VTQTPYAQIAGELRHRIQTGELAPGDRVPSIRAITQRWGVAIATATKALAALRHDGLVKAAPGVGAVVADTVPQARSARASADDPAIRTRIVRAASTACSQWAPQGSFDVTGPYAQSPMPRPARRVPASAHAPLLALSP